ncbi:restriction endonuclease [Lacihabitans sp. LS3-19]|uniref:McrC family protein n=1 Tax=Lacihabitans sp. LS3-19 TaxID=2487335 RepID=UPI0020CDE37B|nr:McrC family protein [Lacihabitans sp. LS3-19]MCP9769434.1 restriction endonuclease [Lacihabitans sp. LS3-19]
MTSRAKHITIFEHQAIRLDQEIGGVKFDANKLKALQRYYGEKGVPYFSLIHNGIRFNNFVGVIQVGNTIIEVLPKADNIFTEKEEKAQWHKILIDMLFEVGFFNVQSPSNSSLKLKPNAILDLYFELFIKEIEYLLHLGLVKKYRKKEGNISALKGSIQFAKHIQQNLTHQERCYVSHTSYDVEHKLHQILYKAIKLLKQINTNAGLQSRIGALLLHFPAMPDIKVNEATFNTLTLNRKTQSYKKAINIAKLLLLQFHPDVSQGRNDVLAIMFDMNKLWERFVFKSLSKNKSLSVKPQISKHFWVSSDGDLSKMRPDIIIEMGKETFVVDTKWKNLKGYNPSPEDLRQMFVYHEYYAAKKVALVYPNKENNTITGNYLKPESRELSEKECSIISIAISSKVDNERLVKTWQKDIETKFTSWIGMTND